MTQAWRWSHLQTTFGMPGALGPEFLTTKLIGRDISSTCSSSGSAIWASAKDIKPLVDANCHTEAMEFAYHQSPIQFSPIRYRNHESKSHSPSGDTFLFGCPLELCTVGELKIIPPVLEYLLDSVRDWPTRLTNWPTRLFIDLPLKNQREVLYSAIWKYWPLVNELERAWTGVEGTNRAIISKLALQDNHRPLILVCPLQYTI